MTGCPICRLQAMDRRAFLLGAGAAVAVGAGAAEATQRPAQGAGLIDVHHHIIPPAYIDWYRSISPPAVGQMGWTPQQSIDVMDRNHIDCAMTSLMAPGVALEDIARGRTIARGCNDYAAQLCTDHPGRFGMFASLPALDPEGALVEIAHAFDVLHADGAGLMTSYHGKYLANPFFAPMLEELNRRHAVIFVHPNYQVQIDPAQTDMVLLEMPVETARTLLGLVKSGALLRYPNLKWIFAHGGGALPILYQRIDFRFSQDARLHELYPNGMVAALTNVWFDIVGVSTPLPFDFIQRLYGDGKLLFGTDHPAVEGNVTSQLFAALDLPQGRRDAIGRGNAERLFPRLRAGRNRISGGR
jgi:predicted TIM-barrel fold metal-dependent hydrolase